MAFSAAPQPFAARNSAFYHHRDYQRQQYVERILRQNDPLRPSAPLPKTLPGVRVTLYEVLIALADNRINARRAGKLLYAMQQASICLRKPVN
jgi:hypothetical protein